MLLCHSLELAEPVQVEEPMVMVCDLRRQALGSLKSVLSLPPLDVIYGHDNLRHRSVASDAIPCSKIKWRILCRALDTEIHLGANTSKCFLIEVRYLT